MSAMGTKLIVLGGFLVAFAAGLVTGIQQSPPVSTSVPIRVTSATGPSLARGGLGERGRGPRPLPPPSILARELNLESEQRTKLEAIWKEVAMLGMREMDQQQQQLKREFDDEVFELLQEEVAEEYAVILDSYEQQRNALTNQWWQQYRNGVDQTKAILNPQQLERFEQIMRRNWWNPDRDGRGGRGGRGQGSGRGGDNRNGDGDGGRDGNRRNGDGN